MMKIDCRISLKNFNSFAVDAYAKELFILESNAQLDEVLTRLNDADQSLIIGGGSNILFRQDFHGLVAVNQLKGRQLLSEDNDFVIIKAGAGENWHDFVRWTLANNYYGLENLSLIPGTVGAAPVQNIGAYGVELAQYIENLEVVDLESNERQILFQSECEFAYRDSIFKKQLDRYLIVSVNFKLSKQLDPVLGYSGVRDKLIEQGVQINNPTALQISDAVCALRISKLPLPEKIGNAGSFFKNPTADSEVCTDLRMRYPDMPQYKQPSGQYKISAAWLIEQCGWKGFREGDAGVYLHHALVLVNHGQATGRQIWQLADKIQHSVLDKFGIEIEPEPRIIP